MLGCDSCCEKWKNEFKIKNCYLQHVPSEDLVRSQVSIIILYSPRSKEVTIKILHKFYCNFSALF